jgi:hypothetical protein
LKPAKIYVATASEGGANTPDRPSRETAPSSDKSAVTEVKQSFLDAAQRSEPHYRSMLCALTDRPVRHADQRRQHADGEIAEQARRVEHAAEVTEVAERPRQDQRPLA